MIKTPEDGFEPPLEEPESSVLPLDDSGMYYNYKTKFAFWHVSIDFANEKPDF